MLDLALAVVLAVIAAAFARRAGHRLGGRDLAKLLVAGVVMRFVGCVAKYNVIEVFYDGIGDAKMYFAYGSHYADMIHDGDLGFLTDYQKWRGTLFIRFTSGFIQSVIGSNELSLYFIFSMFSYVGLVFFAVAFSRTRTEPTKLVLLPVTKMLLFWPSLWFWPSSVGKESLMILGMCLVIYGYVGRNRSIRWLPLIVGMAITLAIRPHITAALGVACATADWMGKSPERRMSVGSKVQLVITAVIAAMTVYKSATTLGGEDVDLIGLQEEYEYRATQTQLGGSEIGASPGIWALPMAFVNIYMRPFPWEAGHVLQLASSLEVWFLWGVLFLRRRQMRMLLKNWRQSRFLTVTAFVAVLVGMMYGLTFFNLGIISRQRVIVLPLLIAPAAYALFMKAKQEGKVVIRGPDAVHESTPLQPKAVP